MNDSQKKLLLIILLVVIGAIYFMRNGLGVGKGNINKFLDSYNKITDSENNLIDFMQQNAETRQRVIYLPDNILSPLQQNIALMTNAPNNDCAKIPDKKLQKDCLDLFEQYGKILSDVRIQGVNFMLNKQLLYIIPEKQNFIKKMTEKYPKIRRDPE
ncbi:MAG: hypothetical protein Q4A74_04935 [Cardiobacteriaceae bacterium]|nr:hypothetical protein [Cardiobacteriaceae bacterium]